MDAARRPRFNTYILQTAREIWTKAQGGNVTYEIATYVAARLPIGEYTFSLRLWKNEISKSDLAFADASLAFAKTMMSRGLRKPGPGREFVNWIAVQYAAGQSLFKVAWERINAGKPIPEPYSKKYSELMQRVPMPDFPSGLPSINCSSEMVQYLEKSREDLSCHLRDRSE